ncbi:MAG: transcription elongation factor GreA [Coriobacteriales bacterium]|jgi:transcription elongation factor GreA|nr:transcription elongation factor GreA [Coriobacteriales bacterium]
MAKDIILTPEGRVKLEQELHELETVKRIEIGERIRIAREFGDISENSEYDDAKTEQAWMESRIAEITQILSMATVVETPKRSNKVSVGSTVTVTMADGTERTFTIVGAAEADITTGRISNESPVGAALLGAKKGDVVSAEAPNGKVLEFTIVKISR